jgi:hypothetical protein
MSVGAGVISDISNRAERGGFFGLFMLGPLVSWNLCLLMQSLRIFEIGGPIYSASNRRRTVRFIRMEVYHFYFYL